jgi:hypothetical protein
MQFWVAHDRGDRRVLWSVVRDASDYCIIGGLGSVEEEFVRIQMAGLVMFRFVQSLHGHQPKMAAMVLE